MSVPSFNTFIAHTNNTKKLSTCIEAEEVYNFLSLDTCVNKMIEATNNNRSALFGVLTELENRFGSNNGDFSFTENFVRTIVGKMISEVMAASGYKPDGKDNEDLMGKYFHSAARYEKV